MKQTIGYWILITVVIVFITAISICEYDFTTKEKIKIICGFIGFIIVLRIALMLMGLS